MIDEVAAVTATSVEAEVTVSEPSTYEVGLYEPEDPPEQCVTYVPTGCAPVSAVAYPVSDDAYTAHVGSTDQSPATVDGEVV